MNRRQGNIGKKRVVPQQRPHPQAWKTAALNESTFGFRKDGRKGNLHLLYISDIA